MKSKATDMKRKADDTGFKADDYYRKGGSASFKPDSEKENTPKY